MEHILSKLAGVKETSGGKWQAKCPCHDDKTASLSITKADDKIVLFCHAGCQTQDILNLIGLEFKHLFTDDKPKEYRVAKTIKVTYQYADLDGKLLYEAVRYEPKGFSQRRPDGSGGWIWDMKGIRRILFNLKAVTEAAQNGKTVIIVEGEKDAQTLINQGIIATTNVGGAGKWLKSYSETLTGAKVVILPDNDEAGREHAEKAAKSLKDYAASIKVVELPDLNLKEDITDWFNKHEHIPQELIKLVKQTPEWKPVEEHIEFNALDFTDTANAERLIETFNNEVLFNRNSGKWLVWNGEIWQQDDNGEVIRRAQKMLRTMYALIPKQRFEQTQKALLKHIVNSLSEKRIQALLKLAQAVISVTITNTDINQSPYLLCVGNGTIDLRTGELMPFNKADYITKQIAIDYKPEAKCPQWDTFLLQTQPEEDVRNYLQRAVGYTLTGDISEQCLFFSYGSGRNGKSTFIETISKLLGSYYFKAQSDTIMIKNYSSSSNDIAALDGKRMVSASELSGRQRLNESLIKDMTGQDAVSARFLYKEQFNFYVGFKLWLYGNEKPKITGHDDGIWRRIKLIPWAVQIAQENVDSRLREKLNKELEGILNWAVRGAVKWMAEGLLESNTIKCASENYRTEQDELAEFLEECCEFAPENKVKKAEIWAKYQEYSANSGNLFYEKQVRFNKALKNRGGITDTVLAHGVKGFQGIKLKNSNSQEDDYSLGLLGYQGLLKNTNSLTGNNEKEKSYKKTVTEGNPVTQPENTWWNDNDDEYEDL